MSTGAGEEGDSSQLAAGSSAEGDGSGKSAPVTATSEGDGSGKPAVTATSVGGGSGKPAPVKATGGYYVANAWSQAGQCTCIMLRQRNGPKKSAIVFDMGVCPPEVMGVEHVFITHGHLDHCGAIFTHARLRGRDLPPAKYYMNPQIVPAMLRAKGAFEELGEDELPMEIVPIQPGEEVSIGNGCYVAPFPTAHRVPSQGYIIRDRRPRGLKPEYQGLPTAALKELRAAGVEVGQLTDTVEVAFTGDTSFAPLLEQEEIWRAKILILEMTYLDGTLDGAVKWCHTHLSEVAASAHRFSGVRELIACHVTARKSRFDAMRLLRKALPRDLAERTSVMLRLFGADEEAVRLLREALPRDLAARTGVMLRLFGADEAVTPVCDPAS